MSLKLHPDWLPESLEQTYKALIKYSRGGQIHVTTRQLMTELQLSSPAPLTCRLQALAKRGVIQFA